MLIKATQRLFNLAVRVQGHCPHWFTAKKYEMTGDGFEVIGTRCIFCEKLIDWNMKH